MKKKYCHSLKSAVIVYFGVNIPQLCYDIQTRVKRIVEDASGEEVKAVNITVIGIDAKDDTQE